MKIRKWLTDIGQVVDTVHGGILDLDLEKHGSRLLQEFEIETIPEPPKADVILIERARQARQFGCYGL